jgi:hypothetical protein
MALAPGVRLGPYEVVAPIGEGGMGAVWRARHATLKRDDALKVLPDAFASDPGRLARFEREWQVLASLNHPNIARVYGVERSARAKTQVQPLLHTSFSERNPHLSPDGHWMVYESDESGQNEIYVRPFPDVDAGRWQVSAGGGVQPVWARSGRELFYRNGPALMAVPIQTAPVFSAGKPTMLFQGQYLLGPGGPTYDISPDGRRFLMVKQGSNSPIGAGVPFRFVIVENWIEDLKRLVPTN